MKDWIEYYKELSEYLTDEYSLNDTAHHIDHVKAVCNRALCINAAYRLGYDPFMIIAAALYHDLFTRFRDNHHYLAEVHILTSKHWSLRRFDDEQRVLIGKACLEHRASWKGGYSSTLSELIATADRGSPNNLTEMVTRCYSYGISKLKQTPQEALDRVLPHLREKYSRTGYQKLSSLYMRVYGSKLEAMWDVIETGNIDVVGIITNQPEVIEDIRLAENNCLVITTNKGVYGTTVE